MTYTDTKVDETRQQPMDARAYLEQVSDLHHTIVTMQMRLREQQYALDMLKTALGDGMPRGSSDGKALENTVVEHQARMEEYAAELARWTDLRRQAYAMLDRARAELSDGAAHWIDVRHIDVLEQHYMHRMQYAKVATAMGYSERTVKDYAAQALNWLDHAVDSDGYPLVPIVSE